MVDKIFGQGLRALPLTVVQTPAVIPDFEAKPQPVYFAGGLNAGVNAATTATAGVVKKAPAQADSTASTVAALVTDFNALLAKLRTAGILS